MVKVLNPFTELNGNTVGNVKNWLYASAKGSVFILHPGEETKDPVLQVGGEENQIVSTADREVEGTVDKTSYKEGLRTNPLLLFPSSFFSPIPPWINSVLPGPLSVLNSPELLVTILAVVALDAKDEETYSYHRETLPAKVTDNQELEDILFN